ncbi:hypothetical protein [Paenibacillus sp. DP01]|uniref:hypothetical protein n=1 Tax=Paenibacillus sp. DP01 TaxID=3373096 RepID=UPI00384ED398
MANVNYREVKRGANVGERIKIVNPQLAIGYGKGDEGSVTETRTSGVFAQINGRRCGVWHEEYVVLEPVASTNTPDISDAFTQFIRDNADVVRAILGDVTKTEPAALTRAAVIEKARADVAELERGMYSRVEFHVNRDKRVVTAVIKRRSSGTVRARGIAKAAPDDVFHAEIGKAIALRRALGLAVPSEYTDAPKPTEKLANMLIRCVSGETRKLTDSPADFNLRNCAMLHSWNGRNGTVIDDTDVDYSVITEGAAA